MRICTAKSGESWLVGSSGISGAASPILPYLACTHECRENGVGDKQAVLGSGCSNAEAEPAVVKADT